MAIIRLTTKETQIALLFRVAKIKYFLHGNSRIANKLNLPGIFHKVGSKQRDRTGTEFIMNMIHVSYTSVRASYFI
jgi:hypothetical protein